MIIYPDCQASIAHPNFEDRPNPIRLRLAYDPEAWLGSQIEAAWIETAPSIWLPLPVDAAWALVGGRPDRHCAERPEHVLHLDAIAEAESECAA